MPFKPKSHRTKATDSRGSSTQRGYGKEHRKLRLLVLARDPLCKLCPIYRPGLLENLSTCADHIDPRTRGMPGIGLEHYQGACKQCNDRKRDSLPAGGGAGSILGG
jgi:5-methylcytosine-specific restriction endonuclease McrA